MLGQGLWVLAFIVNGLIIPAQIEPNYAMCIMDKSFYEQKYHQKMTCGKYHAEEINDRYKVR